MGTRGYKVYRSKGRYFVYYNRSDSYPSCFGICVASEIPRDVPKEEFEEWVRSTQDTLDAEYEELKNNSDEDDAFVADEQPYAIFIDYVYEIDLDNLVFHIDSQPLYRLDNMPPDDVFLKTISFDHFGHRAFYEHTPVQFRYNWHAPPPSPPPKSLIAYNSCPNRSSTSSIHELLRIPMALSSIERARTALVELLVARCMPGAVVGHDVRVLESVPDCDHISQSVIDLALSLVNFAVGPPIPELPCNPRSDTRDFIWVRKDVCVRITTHLDDEDNLHASIGDLVHHINTTRDKMGTFYGVACSIFYCAIVRVDKDTRGTSFAHTPALQFLPSFYARNLSTPGIEALSRLGCQSSGVEFLADISEAYNLPCITHKELLIARSVVEKVPVEVWANVGHFITSPRDLVNLSSISPRAMSAATDLARYPWVMEFRLVDVVDSIPPTLETKERTDVQENIDDYDYGEDNELIEKFYFQLGCTKFTAVKGGRQVTVELGQQDHKTSYGRKEMSFQVQTYLSGPAALKGNELYVLELDDDNNLNDKA